MQEAPIHLSVLDQQLVAKHLVFARQLTKKFFLQNQYSGIEFDEFQGAAYLGLCLASKRFVLERGVDFKTFSYKRIKGEMLSLLENRYALREMQIYEPDPDLVPEDLFFKNIPKEFFCDSKQENNLEQKLIRSELIYYLKYKIDKLPEKQKRLMRLRYFDGKNISEICQAFGYANRSWIWKLHDQAIRSLKKFISHDLKKCQTNLMLYKHQQNKKSGPEDKEYHAQRSCVKTSMGDHWSD